jgi:hypothetical protein
MLAECQRAWKDIMNAILKVAKSALIVLILGRVVEYDPRHRIALVDISLGRRKFTYVRSGDSGSDQPLVRHSFWNSE